MTTPALALIITAAGMTRFTAAQLGSDIDLTVTAVGLTDQEFVAAPTLTALPGVFRTVATISGAAVAPNIVHMIIRDESDLEYRVRGFGLYLADGTLFAVYGQASAIVQKSALSTMLLAIDIAFPAANVANLTFGDTTFIDPPATVERRGVVELATPEETAALTDPVRAVTPIGLKAVVDALHAAIDGLGNGVTAALAALTTRRITGAGLASGGGSLDADQTITVSPASAAELRAATDATKAVTPASFGGLPRLAGSPGYEVLPGGMAIQRGQFRAALNGQQTLSITFPIAFADPSYDLQLTSVIPGADNYDNYPQEIDGTRTTAGVSVFIQDPSDGALGTISGFNWRAEGRVS